ncbi:MAG: YbhB/YbcL family Raf kinase inhibitor-like protein [Calditrichaeota bacterium]|nr:MAG: YbhB/YbcL family Raf kinase inhibitor-like protein [Calditrichota bacterium]
MRVFYFSLIWLVVLSGLKAQTFTVTSSEVGGQATEKQVFKGFGCTGRNISPQLSWRDAPEGTKSFAVTMYDPDAPTGSGWWHWVVFNLPAEVHELASGAGDPSKGLMPRGAVQSVTDFGKSGYGGPCPPKGDGPHAYIITVHALDTKALPLDASANPALVGFHINAHTLAKASLVFYYERK